MSQHDDPTRRLLAPRRPAAAAPPPPPPARTASTGRWAITLLVSTLAGAALLWAWLAARTELPAAASRAEAVAAAPPALLAPASAPLAAPTPAATTRTPRPADIDEMLAAPADADWRWWRFSANPAVLVIEFPTLHEQGLAMNRLAALLEKRGVPRDRLLSDAELSALLQRSGDTTATFYQGHDYPAVELARFYSLARTAPTPLNAQEERLLALLLDAGVLAADPQAGYRAAGRQAVVSFSGLQADDPATPADEEVDARRREAVLRHELSHGEFFTDPAYRAHSLAFWSRAMTSKERQAWRSHLASLDYDPQDEELMANETQAMLMHTPDPRAFSAGALGVSEAELASMRARFRAGEPRHGLQPGGR